MFGRWFATGSAALLGFVGVVMLDCTLLFLDLTYSIDICVEADLVVPGGSTVVGVILIAAGLGLAGYAWIPYMIERRRETEGLEMTSEALVKNVHRLPVAKGRKERTEPALQSEDAEEVSVDLRQPAPRDELPSPGEDLLDRVEDMEVRLGDEKEPLGPVARQWIELLREAHELRLERAIDETSFGKANSRLLAMYASPEDEPDSARPKADTELIS